MADFVDSETGENVTTHEEFLRRKVFYIHGTIAKPNRWNNFPDTLFVCNVIAMAPKSEQEKNSIKGSSWIKENCVFFNWFGETRTPSGMYNSLDNNVLDRKKASDKLVSEIIEHKNKSSFNEIVLIGHSHGGNVALQVANRLAGLFEKVYILTIATPAQNSPYIDSSVPSKELIEIREKRVKGIDKGTLYFYQNPECPDNIINWAKVTHLALWNKMDEVDGYALAMDIFKDILWGGAGGGGGMTLKSENFDSSHTQNVEFNISDDFRDADRAYRTMCMWRYKLMQLYHTLYGYAIKGYDLNYLKLPQLKNYEDFAKEITKKPNEEELSYLKSKMTVIHQSGTTPKYTGDTLRKCRLEQLFTSIYDYGYFLGRVDELRCNQSSFLINTTAPTTDIRGFYTEISSLVTAKYLFFKEIEILYRTIDTAYNINRTVSMAGEDFPTHGFDLAHPEEIQRAIDEGRIKPFERVKSY